MLTHPDARVFWPDEDYDGEYASDGVSRYGAYQQGIPVTATAKEAMLRLCGVLGGEVAGLLCAWGELR